MDTQTSRKARGAFFTPVEISRYLAKWAIQSADDVVLEPSCGEASFLLAAGERLRGNRFRLFTGRDDPAGRDEQYEAFYFMLLDASAEHANYSLYRVGDHKEKIAFEDMICELVEATAVRNPDFYEYEDGKLRSVSG